MEQEILAGQDPAEKVEQTTEQNPKIYTQAEFDARLDALLGKKIARREAKLRKEYEQRIAGLRNPAEPVCRKTAAQRAGQPELPDTQTAPESPDFLEFAGKFRESTPIQEIYSLYAKSKTTQNLKTMGSMRYRESTGGIKDFYSREESMRLTRQDLRNNPALLKAVQDSMAKW